MFLSGLGTATPAKRYTQSECWDALVASDHLPTLDSRSQAILRKVLRGNNGICSRFLAFDDLSEAFELEPRCARCPLCEARTGGCGSSRATVRSRMRGSHGRDIDAVIISTCTGYLCPGLTSYVTELLDLRTDILALDLVGQGCGAALPNMRTGEALIEAGRASRVLSICVEICSAAMYLDNDPGVLISACLFGDGAGAAVLTADSAAGSPTIRVEVGRARFSTRGIATNCASRNARGMLRNILSPAVPALAAKHVGRGARRASRARRPRAPRTSRPGSFMRAGAKF